MTLTYENKIDSDSSWSALPLAGTPETIITGLDLLNYLRESFLEIDVIDELVKSKILDRECERREIESSEAEVEEWINKFRVQKHLLTGTATLKWLEQRHLNGSQLWTIFERRTRADKLKKKLFDDEAVNEEFALRKSRLSKVHYYQIVVKQERKALELAALIKANNSFFDLAKEYSEDEQSRYACGYGGVKFVFEFEPEIQQHLAAVSDGDVIGPIKCIGQHYLIYVDRFFPAVLSEPVREDIRNKLFRDWCSQEIKATPVEILFDK